MEIPTANSNNKTDVGVKLNVSYDSFLGKAISVPASTGKRNSVLKEISSCADSNVLKFDLSSRPSTKQNGRRRINANVLS